MVEECLVEPPVKGFGVRHGQVILQFLFYIIIGGIRVSLAATIPQIVSSDDVYSNLTNPEISTLLSCYLLSFIVTGLFGGWVCKKFGFKWPMVIAMFIIAGPTIYLPAITKSFGYQGLLACRIVQGLCAGLVFPMPADFISRWIPVQERTVLGTTIYASGIIGGVLGLHLSASLSSTYLGWTFVYTLYGYLALIWAILMWVLGSDSPEEYSHTISEDELNYIIQSRGNANTKTKVQIPWRQLLTSKPFWAIIVAQIGATWLFGLASGNIMIFLYAFYGVSMHTGVNFIILTISWIFTFIFSAVAQHFIQERKTTILQSRKIFNTIGCLVPALILILFLVLPAWNQYQGVILFTLLSLASVATIVGSKININDISSNFAPIIFGTANWIGMVFSVIVTTIFNLHEMDNWTELFLFTVVLLILTNTFYLYFGSGEDQMWAPYEEVRDEESELSNSTSRASNGEGKYLLFVKKQ